MNYTVIFAGGVGVRMGSNTPKQFLKVGGKPIIIHVLEKFANHPEIDGIVVVCKEEYIDECKAYISDYGIGTLGDAAFKDIAMNLNELFDNSIFPVGGENVDFAKYFDGKS